LASAPHSSDDVFVGVPPRLNAAHLASVLSQRLGRDTTISGYEATNLCARNWRGVSDSGATVLRLSLALDDGHTHDLVAKILSPDLVNLFKVHAASRRGGRRLHGLSGGEGRT